jgi:hypothetical protein
MRLYLNALLATILLFIAFKSVDGAERTKEMALATDVGEVVLTVEPCPLKNEYGFEYYGYATEKGAPDHIACWNADDQIVQIWFINEKIIATYKKSLFKPRVEI